VVLLELAAICRLLQVFHWWQARLRAPTVVAAIRRVVDRLGALQASTNFAICQDTRAVLL